MTIPSSYTAGTDFMMVSANLVRHLGSAVDALVWTRILWRCEYRGDATVTDADGTTWWPAPREVLAEETGLTVDQCRRSIERLMAGGHLEACEQRQAGPYDRTKSYRAVLEEGGPNGNPENVEKASTPNVDGASTPDVPSSQTLDIPLGDVADPPAPPKPKGRRAPETAFPEGIVPNDACRTFATANGLDLRHEYEQFKAHALANDRRLRDWQQGLRMWLGNAAARKPAPKAPPGIAPADEWKYR